MEASIVDLRYKMSDVLKALDRNESVTVLYHGKAKAIMTPVKKQKKAKNIKDHPFYGMASNDGKSVADVMDELRAPRY